MNWFVFVCLFVCFLLEEVEIGVWFCFGVNGKVIVFFFFFFRQEAEINILSYLVTYTNRMDVLASESKVWSGDFVDCPQQENLFDCGVFMLQAAFCVVEGIGFNFSSNQMERFRRKMVFEIKNGRFLL